MCPCHGGAYYADGSRASGPPERGLFEYRYKIEGDTALHRGRADAHAGQPAGEPSGVRRIDMRLTDRIGRWFDQRVSDSQRGEP